MRQSKQQYYMSIAISASKRSTCNRAQVGTCLVKHGVVIGTGYNGSAIGEPSCIESECSLNETGNCTKTVHSEINALINCAKVGTSSIGAELYCTHHPCSACSRAIINAKISKVYFWKEYKGDGSIKLSDYIEVEQLKI